MYLVSGHTGGVYLSNSDYASITETCETCFDSDTVEFEFSEDDAYNAVCEYDAQCKQSGEYFWGPHPAYFCEMCRDSGLITQEQADELVEKLGWNREEETDEQED